MVYSRVLSIRDIDYDIIPNTCYHPALITSAIQRIRARDLTNELNTIMSDVMSRPEAAKVWAVVIKKNNSPPYVLKNLALSKTSLAYRRVLQVLL